MNKYILLLAAGFLCLFTSCSSETKKDLTVIATAVPHAEMLEFIKPDLEARGVHLRIVVTDDYQLPNRSLAYGEADANFFQHESFLREQIRQNRYPVEILAGIEFEPMGLYSKKLRSLDHLKNKAVVALPNDPTNEARALLLLEKAGLLRLDPGIDLKATIINIRENPKELKFIEVDSAMLPRTLPDVDLAVINTNYALQADLSPFKDALLAETNDSPYVNVLVVRKDAANREDLEVLKEVMTSEKMKSFLLEKYRGAVLPAF